MMAVDVLAAQVADSRRRLAAALQHEPLEELRARASEEPPPPSFRAALSGAGVAVIAEIKRGSPSRGPLAPSLDPTVTASRYLTGGAAAISVLTAPQGFAGSLGDLAEVSRLGAPTLRKDFLIDPYQVWEARAAGASAVLLLAVVLSDDELEAMIGTASEAGLDALVEVHDETEMARVNAHRPSIVGVNVRDLRDFSVENDRFGRVAQGRPSGSLLVAESGVNGPEDVVAYAAEGADAVLVGEHLVTSDDPVAATRMLVDAGSDATMRQGQGADR